MTVIRPASLPMAWRILLILAGLGLIISLSHVLMPFVLGWLLAYVCHPLARRLTQSWLPASAAALLVLVLLFGLLLGLGLLIVPMIVHELDQVFTRLPQALLALRDNLPPALSGLLGLDGTPNPEALRSLVQQHLGEAEGALRQILGSARAGGAVLLETLLTVLLVPVVLFYLLKDWKGLWARLLQRVPRAQQETTLSLAREIDQMLGQYLRGQLLVMITMALLYASGLYLVGLHSGVALGALSGLLVFIPYVGVFSGFLLALLAALIQGPGLSMLLPVVGVYALGHLLEGSLITPRLVGQRIGLHPLVVILALLSFGKLLGFFGILIALPASAILRLLLERLMPVSDPAPTPQPGARAGDAGTGGTRTGEPG